jgi:hypothetical protein
VKLGGNHGNLPAGAKASVGARIAKANSRTSDLEFIIEELKAAGAISPRQLTVVVSAKGIKLTSAAHGRSERQGHQDGNGQRLERHAGEARGLGFDNLQPYGS